MNGESDSIDPFTSSWIRSRRVQVRLFVGGLVLGLVVYGIHRALKYARYGAEKSATQVNVHQIALGIHNYESVNGSLAPWISDPNGKPLLSWRVAILPYIEQEPLYKAFVLTEPWDGPNNIKLLPQMPRIYTGRWWKPREVEYKTFFRAFVGKGAAFEPDKSLKLNNLEFPDGLANTILFVEADEAVLWTKPDEIPFQPGSLPRLGGLFPHADSFLAAMADGSVRSFKRDLGDDVLRALITRGGGEILPPIK